MKLPDLVEIESYEGDAKMYIEALYNFFKKDFIVDGAIYKNAKIAIIKEPKSEGKEWTFWHITSCGGEEDKRVVDMRKCEKIRWIKPIIESTESGDIKFWRNKRGKDRRVCLCYGDWEYIVVLIDRREYAILCTAYPIERNHTKEKLKQEYKKFNKTNTAI